MTTKTCKHCGKSREQLLLMGLFLAVGCKGPDPNTCRRSSDGKHDFTNGDDKQGHQ